MYFVSLAAEVALLAQDFFAVAVLVQFAVEVHKYFEFSFVVAFGHLL